MRLAALQATSHAIGESIRAARRKQLDRVGPDDPDSPIRVLAELDILNAFERIRSCYINVAETLADGKGVGAARVEGERGGVGAGRVNAGGSGSCGSHSRNFIPFCCFCN